VVSAATTIRSIPEHVAATCGRESAAIGAAPSLLTRRLPRSSRDGLKKGVEMMLRSFRWRASVLVVGLGAITACSSNGGTGGKASGGAGPGGAGSGGDVTATSSVGGAGGASQSASTTAASSSTSTSSVSSSSSSSVSSSASTTSSSTGTGSMCIAHGHACDPFNPSVHCCDSNICVNPAQVCCSQDACAEPIDCCQDPGQDHLSQTCRNNQCTVCYQQGFYCNLPSQCCDGTCVNHTCGCIAAGIACNLDLDCCSMHCNAGVCG
jgi:hypothetical protein